MTKFKVGDKVRILNAEAIDACEANAGDILDVVGLSSNGTPYLMDVDGEELLLFESELRFIEKINDEITETQRIAVLETKIARLEEKFAALKEAL